jgi:hypothetical protein
MRGRDFLDLARGLAAGPTEPYWRTAAVQAYYALFLECRDALSRWGFPPPPRQNVHAYVRLRFTYASFPDLKILGRSLDHLVNLRNPASYDLRPLSRFQSPQAAQQAVQDAEAQIALLDAIEADPARLAAAIASLPP